jgi:hypothetical protein
MIESLHVSDAATYGATPEIMDGLSQFLFLIRVAENVSFVFCRTHSKPTASFACQTSVDSNHQIEKAEPELPIQSRLRSDRNMAGFRCGEAQVMTLEISVYTDCMSMKTASPYVQAILARSLENVT